MRKQLLDLVFSLGVDMSTGKPQWQCDVPDPDGTITRYVPGKKSKLKPSSDHRHFGCLPFHTIEKSARKRIHIVLVRLVEEREDVPCEAPQTPAAVTPFDRSQRKRANGTGFSRRSA